jgi:hypothetical protein
MEYEPHQYTPYARMEFGWASTGWEVVSYSREAIPKAIRGLLLIIRKCREIGVNLPVRSFRQFFLKKITVCERPGFFA